jgi:hypothetical protein
LPGSDPEPDHAGERDLLTATIREAGALALATFQTPLKTWTKAE